MEVEYSIYLGAEQKNGFTGFLAEKNFFCVVEIFDGYSSEEGEQLMSALAEVGNTSFETLIEFDSHVSALFKRLNTPLDTSIAIGYKKNQTMYLKTVGTGEIYLGRGKAFERIIEGPINAAGKYEQNDFYIFTTSFFTQSLKGITHTKPLIHKKAPIRDFPEHIKQAIGAEDDTGAVALFVRMIQHQETYVSGSLRRPIGQQIGEFFQKNIQTITSLDGRKKSLIGLALFLCVCLFGWNLIRGIQNKGGLQITKGASYEEKIVQIKANITQAESKNDEVEEGLQLLQTASSTLTLLTKTAPKDKLQEVQDLQRKIIDTESLLVKRTFSQPKEFYDFALEEKNAQGSRLSLFEDKAYVLNPVGKVYILTLDKKSIQKVTLTKAVSTNALVAGYEKNTYILEPSEGLIKITTDEKPKVVIPKETQWNSISSLQVYSGNVYMLDGGNNALYKYPVTSDGYGDRVSYFKGSYTDIDTSSTFAIDVSVYVSGKDGVTKYTAGLRDNFKLTIPGNEITFTKVITHTDQTKLYIWDKKKSVMYITSREGSYEKQVGAPLFGQATDVEVYNDNAYLLKGSKLYTIEL